MPAESSPRPAAKTPLFVRIDSALKARLARHAFKRSWADNRRVGENTIVEAALRTYLDAQEKKS